MAVKKTDNPAQSQPKDLASNSILAQLAEWKAQLLALILAPFAGLGFVFDFLLRAKDFPELASAMWAFVGLFTGILIFAILLTCAAFTAAGAGVHERGVVSRGEREFLKWLSRLFALAAVLALAITANYALIQSATGFGKFVAPYVDWLKIHSGQQ